MATFLISLIWGVYLLDCLLLIGIILLQPGEGGDVAAAFGGSSSQTAFGARGSATFIQKLTTGLAIGFMVLSVTLVIVTNFRQRSIMQQYAPEVKTEAPANKPAANAPANAPAAPVQTAPTNAPAAPVASQPIKVETVPAPANAPAQAPAPATAPAKVPPPPAQGK